MSVEVLNGVTLEEFIEDEEAFKKCLNDYFVFLDVNCDGVLSLSDLQVGFDCILTLEEESGSDLVDMVFQKFDADQSGALIVKN